MLEFIQSNETLSTILIVVSLLFNVVLALKPVFAFIVKKTKTTTDDEIFEKVFGLIDKMSDETKQKLLDQINK